ncbi:MAG TPA: IPTL-CTERM sorting domain-containing protein [Thermodesulfovibrionales bacterium]|nr:IPTL-CTERM sorting domain-containing protein [Thermodesulfovibrionales bacterium]
MKRMLSLWILAALITLLIGSQENSFAVPGLSCNPVTGSPPAIDGVYNLSQWPAVPQIAIATPIQTNFYCMSDASNLYVLVDALGDTTDDNNNMPTHGACPAAGITYCDECLLVFSDTGGTTISQAEVWGKSGPGNTVGSHLPTGSQASIGFNGHRFYEWKIPLSSINATPGQVILLSSPKLCKGVSNGGSYCASMPYDGFDGRDNEWPSGVLYHDVATWRPMKLADPLVAVPTLTEWGVIVFALLAGLGAIYYLSRRKTATS